MTEIRLDSYCRQKVAYHAKVALGGILFLAAMAYSLGWLTVSMFVIAAIDRPYDVNSPAARYFMLIIVNAFFVLSVFPLVRNIRKRHTNRTDYYSHMNSFYTTASYTLHSEVSGGKYARTYYYADIDFNGEAWRLQFLSERHWNYLEKNPDFLKELEKKLRAQIFPGREFQQPKAAAKPAVNHEPSAPAAVETAAESVPVYETSPAGRGRPKKTNTGDEQ